MAKVFRKAFRIVGLDGRKCRRVVGKNFMGIFGSILHGFWPFSVASLTEPCSFWYGLTDLSPLHYPWCQRLFMRAFRVWSSLKKWPAPSVEHLSACGRRNKAPRRTREKTSGTQGTSARDRWQIACSRTLIRRSGYCCFKYRSNHSATDAIPQFLWEQTPLYMFFL